MAAADDPFRGLLPGPVVTLEYEGRTEEIECWLSASTITLTFPSEFCLPNDQVNPHGQSGAGDE